MVNPQVIRWTIDKGVGAGTARLTLVVGGLLALIVCRLGLKTWQPQPNHGIRPLVDNAQNGYH